MVQGKKIIEASELPEGERVYLRKDKLGWRLIKPIKKDVDQPWSFSNCNWPNLLFGGWRNLLMLLFIIVVILYHLHEDKLNFQTIKDNCFSIALGEGVLNKSIFIQSNCSANYPRLNVSLLDSYGGVVNERETDK